MNPAHNRRLLVSVFNGQEAREALIGGGRIIDSEDPSTALGNIKPRHIMEIRDAVLSCEKAPAVKLSTNIGEDQLLFDRSATGQALKKSLYETAGKSAQAAIGVAYAMGTKINRTNIVKVGLDAMKSDEAFVVLQEVVRTLNRTDEFQHCETMSVLFAQDIAVWEKRRTRERVRKILVELRKFHPCTGDGSDPLCFDLQPYAVNNLKDENGRILFPRIEDVSLQALIDHGILPAGTRHTMVRLNDLHPHSEYFDDIETDSGRTTKKVIQKMVDLTAEAGANAIMLDTRIQSKVARICLVDTSRKPLIDINRYDRKQADDPDSGRQGILSLDEIRFFVDYCHYRGLEANIAGSIQSYQAQQLWAELPDLDQVSTRGASSAVERNPADTDDEAENSRKYRVVKRNLVRGLAPPEQGGVMNFPVALKEMPEAVDAVWRAISRVSSLRKKRGYPKLQSYYVDNYGRIVEEIKQKTRTTVPAGQ